VLDDSEAVVNQSQGHIDELLTDNVIACLHTDTTDISTHTQTHRHINTQTDRQRQSRQVLDDSEVVVNQSQGQIDGWVTDTAKARLNTHTHQHTDRQTDRQADRQTEWIGAR